MRPGSQIPVLPRQAAVVTSRMVTRESDGCLISSRTPSKDRPHVEIPGGRQVVATRVVAAVAIGRPVEADEDVHHVCENRRSVEPTHLIVELHVDHLAHHAEDQRRELCSVHGEPYDRVDCRTGWNICRACVREAMRRHRERKRALVL
ncbi:HNH endonuclease [Mycobacterium phage CindyLou]|nr:HNH endonuclease [Mycobacterium phage CindyLou]